MGTGQRVRGLTLVTLVVAVLAGCGGGGEPVGPPPPPAPLGLPVTVVIQTGDGQQAEPGTVVPVKPIVLVKEGAGRAVPGVTVTFVVDSGGGSLQAGTAVSAADGTASPGDWRLGSGEGRNVLRAVVGTLAPAKIVATAVVAPVTLADQSVGSAGGTITVTRAGSSIDGMKIVVPAGAFPAGQTIEISYASSAGFVVPAGATVISPLITFRMSSNALAAKPMLVTIPVTVPAGTFPVILLREPTTGRQEPLMTVGYSPTSVTGMAVHLNSSKLMGSDGGFAASRGSLAAGMAGLVNPAATGTAAVVTVPVELLNLDHDTGFRPGVDSWEFPPDESLITDFTATGVVATEAWYYVAKKPANGNLWKRYQEADGVESSNRRGLRWVSLAEEDIYDQLFAELKTIIPTLRGIPPGDEASTLRNLSSASFNSLRTALTLAPGVPQMALLFTADQGTGFAVLVYRSTGQQLFAVDPANPGQTVALDFSSGQMAPLTSAVSSAPFTHLAAVGFSLLAATGELQSQWPAVANGTIAASAYPSYRAMVAWGNGTGESTELKGPVYGFGDPDFPVVWVDCLSCVGEARPPGFPAGTATVAGMEVYARQSSTGLWNNLGATKRAGLGTALGAPGERRFGVELLTLRDGSDPNLYWTDWFDITLRRLQATITPAAPQEGPNTDLDLAIAIPGAPGNLEYVWDFNDGQKVITTALTTTHRWTLEGDYDVKVTARDQTTKQPVAKASTTVTIATPIKAWKFISMTVTFTSVKDQLSGYDSRWRADSAIVGRIADGVTQGGFRIVDQAFTPPGFPLRTAPAGLYLLEGVSLTLANLLQPVTENAFSVATFPNAPLAIPAAPQVSGWNLVQQSAPVNALCNIQEDSYVFTGTVTLGQLVGLRVPLCVQNIDLPSINGQRLMSMDVDVTFGATTATGTISVIYYFYGNGSPIQFFQRVARLTFQAERVQ